MKPAGKRFARIGVFICGLMGCVCMFTCSAQMVYAENDACMSLDKTPRWNNEFNSLMANYKAKQYEDALKNADALNNICSRSPALNFSIAQIYHAMGDDAKGLFYIQRATNSTEKFAVRGELLERMWYTRYEMEHPDATPENIKKMKTENEQLRKEMDTVRVQDMQTKLKVTEDLAAQKSHYAIGLWTGVAGAGVGIVLTGIGAGLLAANSNDAISFDSFKAKAEVKSEVYASTVLLGTGIGMTVIGSAVAGIMGYYYTRIQTDSELAIHMSPMGMQMKILF